MKQLLRVLPSLSTQAARSLMAWLRRLFEEISMSIGDTPTMRLCHGGPIEGRRTASQHLLRTSLSQHFEELTMSWKETKVNWRVALMSDVVDVGIPRLFLAIVASIIESREDDLKRDANW
jgi:hypothetical protein